MTVSAPSGPAHPAVLDLEAPERIARWRPLVQWILVIPHFLILYALGVISQVVWLISFFAVLFTRNIPEGLYNFQVMVQRYGWRTYSYSGFMHDEYPPFDFTVATADPGVTPATLSVERPEQMNRWLPLVKWLLIIPHLIVVMILFFVAWLVWVIAFFAVLITGKFPLGMRTFIVGVLRWYWRVNAYILFLRDEYPPFSLSE
jgi:hypothetical protein